MPTSEAFPGWDLKGKKEKKKKRGAEEANSMGKSNSRLGAGCLPAPGGCALEGFLGGVKGSVVWGRRVPIMSGT